MRRAAGWTIFGLLLIVAVAVAARFYSSKDSAGAAGEQNAPTSALARRSPATQRYNYVIKPGQGIASVLPKSGEWVNIQPGIYGAFTFPASGVHGDPIHYVFEPGAVIDANRAEKAIRGGDYLDIDGLVERNARNTIQVAAVKIGKGTVLRSALIERNDGPGLDFSSDSQAINCTMQWNGQEGFVSAGVKNVLMKDCKLLHNNYGMADPVWKGLVLNGWTTSVQVDGLWYAHPYFESGGGKFSSSDGVVLDGLDSAWNIGGNLSFDINNKNSVIRNCWFHDLGVLKDFFSTNVSIELASDGSALIESNRIHSGANQSGVAIIAIHNVTVRNNYFKGGMGVLFRNDDARGDIAGVTISGNRFDNARVECWGNKFPLRDVKIDGNSFVSGGRPLFRWDGKDYNDLPAVRAGLGFERSGRMVD